LGGDLTIVQPTWAWIEAQAKTGRAPVWRYRFDHAPSVPAGWFGDRPSGGAGAFHAAEIVYALDNLDAVPWTYSEADRQTAAAMSAYWVNFVKTGDPNGAGLPAWPAYGPADGKVMVLGAQPYVSRPDHDARLASLLR
jgi:para-nitrobenzyl esterase